MHKLFRSNPLLDRTLRFDYSPSLRATLILLAVLLTGTVVGHGWLIEILPIEVRAVLLFLEWLLPPITMAMASASTAHRMDEGSILPVQQPPLTDTDTQVIWGLALSTLWTLRVTLVLAFGLLPALIDDTLLGCALTIVCMTGLHLAGAMLGTVLVLRSGQHRWGVVRAAISYLAFLVVLPILSMFVRHIKTPGCPPLTMNPVHLYLHSTNMDLPHPAHLRLDALLLGWGLYGPLAVIAAVLPMLSALVARFIPWRGMKEDRQTWLRTLGLVLVTGLLVGGLPLSSSWAESREHWAMVALYKATGGENWNDKRGWLSWAPVCTWEGISCTCGRVTGLELADNNLQGKLPPVIGQLTNLISLRLPKNHLTELPPEIGQLSILNVLELTDNQVPKLPPEIGRLTRLEWLYLSDNRLTMLPPEIGQLRSLGELGLSRNQLTTLPPEIGQLSRLNKLGLNSNRLTTLPPEFSQLTFVWHLYLENNQFTTLPPEICNLTSLQVLELGGNQLKTLPPEFSRLTHLWILDLSDNQLATLPSELASQSDSLNTLYLRGNPLTQIPPAMCQNKMLDIDIKDELCDN